MCLIERFQYRITLIEGETTQLLFNIGNSYSETVYLSQLSREVLFNILFFFNIYLWLYGYQNKIYINLIKINHDASLIYMNVSIWKNVNFKLRFIEIFLSKAYDVGHLKPTYIYMLIWNKLNLHVVYSILL